MREEVGRHLEEQRRLEAKHAELSLQWDRLIRVGGCDWELGQGLIDLDVKMWNQHLTYSKNRRTTGPPTRRTPGATTTTAWVAAVAS